MAFHSTIGKSIPRIDGLEKVMGKSMYIEDIKLPGMLYGKILRSPYAHARIIGIDTSRAEKLSGVKGVITGREVSGQRYGVLLRDQEVLPTDKVRYIGEKVAAVAAATPEIAEEAIAFIKVEYDELPAVFDPLAAMKPAGPVLHEGLNSYQPGGIFGVVDPSTLKGNICGYAIHQRGDIEQGLAESDLIIENTYTTPFVHQAYLEPHGAIAQVEPDGGITVWTSTQGTFVTRAMLNQIFNLPLNRIRVIPTAIGGGFGGKAIPLVEHICILLAQKTNHPVKIIMTRKEEFIDSTPRHPATITLETGVTRDGTLAALRSKVIMDSGAYAHMGPSTATRAALITQGPYRIPHIKLEGYCVYTNKVGGGAFRAPGFPQATFAIESQIDIIAEQVGIDPLEIRLKNGLRDGDLSFAGERLKKSSFPRVLKALAERIEWGKGKPAKNRGLGLACGQWNVMGMPASATIKVEEDGAVTILTGTVDLTGSNTVFAQIVAEELKIPLGSIRVVTGDTDTAGFSPVSGGSMITYNMGNVVRLAAQDIRRQLFDLASKRLDAKPEDMEIEDGQVFLKGSPEKRLSLGQLSAISMFSGSGVIIGRGSTAPLLPHLVFCAQAAEVEIDPQTGQVTLISLVASQDVGFAINPGIVEGQIQGGVAQGAGFALSEKMVIDQGKVLNTTLAEYRVPTALDLPQIHTLLIEQPSDRGPFGVKGVGEPPTIPTAAAIANAIYNATGVRVHHLPITPEALYQAIKSSRQNKTTKTQVSSKH